MSGCQTLNITTPNGTKVLPEKLTGTQQLIKKFPTSDKTRQLITVFTKARHLSLTSAISVQVHALPSYFSNVHFNIIFISRIPSSKKTLSFEFSKQHSVWICSLSCVPHYQPIPYSLIHNYMATFWNKVKFSTETRPSLCKFHSLIHNGFQLDCQNISVHNNGKVILFCVTDEKLNGNPMVSHF